MNLIVKNMLKFPHKESITAQLIPFNLDFLSIPTFYSLTTQLSFCIRKQQRKQEAAKMCFKVKKLKTPSPTKNSSPNMNNPRLQNFVKHEVLVSLPKCKVHLMDEGEALELASGNFTLIRISDDNVLLATIVKVGDDLQWPLTKDEPVVKLDPLHYLFSLPVKDGNPLSYGVSFMEQGSCANLDKFLKENSCFSTTPLSSSTRNKDIDWKEFAPKVEAYNHVLAKAIAGGTGQIVKGIFICSNAYTNQVKKGGETILTRAVEEKHVVSASDIKRNQGNGATNQSGINKTLKRVRKLTKMTESMSKTMLNGVGIVTGSVMAPVVQSQAGKTFLAMVPGEVLLASLDALNVVLDAAEAAQKQALSATSGAATRIVSQRFGESAGEATGDALATAGHCAGTAWNILKIRKAINPASSVSSGLLKNAAKTRLS